MRRLKSAQRAQAKAYATINMQHSIDSEDFHRHLLGSWRFKTLLLIVILSVIGYFLFMLWAGWENVLAAAIRVGFWGILLALSLSLINYGLRFLRWLFFLKILGYRLPFASSLRIYMSGFALTTTPGKMGEALRGVLLKDHGVPFRKSMGIFFAERLADLLSVTILAMGGLWLHPELRSLLLIVLSVILFILFVVQKQSWLKAIENYAKEVLPERFARMTEFTLETIASFRTCFSTNILGTALLLGIAAWAAEGFALYCLAHMLGYQLSIMTALFIYGFSLVIGGITLLPGGLGGAEVSMLQLLIINGVASSDAVALTLIIRLTTLWFSVILGVIILPKKKIILY